MQRVWLLLAVALVWVCAGCTVNVSAPEVTNPSGPSETVHAGHVDAEVEAPPAQAEAAPLPVKLVPIDPVWELSFQMLVPEGWQVFVTALKDNVQIHGDDVMIMISTRQLRGRPVPMNEQEMMRDMADWAPPNTTIRQLQKPGTVSAFEIRYAEPGNSSRTTLTFQFFGSTHNQWVSLKAPVAEFAKWEPMFREIMASFRPSNLNADPLPGRP